MGVLTLNSSQNFLNYGIVASDYVLVASRGCQINNYVFASPGYLDINATTTVKNCIFYGHNTVRLGSNLRLNASCCVFSMVEASIVIQSNSVLASNNCYFNSNPSFRNIPLYGYRLSGNSTICMNKGASSVNASRDFDGNIVVGSPDIGAYQYTATPSSATFFMRYASIVEYNGDGTAFKAANSYGGRGAWKRFSNVQWGKSVGSVGPGDRLYVCGSVSDMLSVGASGNTNSPLYIYGNNASGSGRIVGGSSCIYTNSKSHLVISNIKTSAGNHFNINVDESKHITLQYNLIENSSTGIRLRNASYIDIHHNILHKGVDGFVTSTLSKTYEINLYNNVIFDMSNRGIFLGASVEYTRIRNNIVASIGRVGLELFPQDVYSPIYEERYNLFYNIANRPSSIIGLDYSTTSTLYDPKFVHTSASNFHLHYDSPCIGVGSLVGVATDYDGYTASGKIDIGVYDQKTAGWFYDKQYSEGYANVVTGSKIVTGDDCVWTPSVSAIKKNNLFRFDYSGAPYYKIGTVLSATKLQLRERYKNASVRSSPYMISRYETPYRGYTTIYQGDSGLADISKEQVFDKVDEDVGRLYNGAASRLKLYVTNSSKYMDLSVSPTGSLLFNYLGKNIAIVTPNGDYSGKYE